MSQNSKVESGELETYLEGKTELSRLYADAPPVELPDHLDAAILAEAHRAVNARPGAKPKRRWAIPLGMVASLLVAVMIGLQLPYMLKDAALSQPAMEKSREAARDKSVAEPTPSVPDERKKPQVMAKAKSEATRSEPAPMAAEAYVGQNAPAAASPAPVMAAKRMELKERAAEAVGALSKEKKSSGIIESNIADSIEQRAPAAVGMAAPQPAQLEGALKKDMADEATLRPEDSLARIKKLKQEGKLEEAKKELAAFKKRYPDYPVPKALEIR